MTRLELAYERLERAITRLETIEVVPAALPADGIAPLGMIEGVEEDEELRGMLEAVRTDYTALQEIAETVRSRLDSTIERIEAVLER